jgi:hypothetical protein
MTVCIAATCEMGVHGKIVLCTDWKLSEPLGSAEIKFKQRNLAPSWILLTAGDEPDINVMYRALRTRFCAQDTIDETNAVELVRNVIAEQKRIKADEYTRSKYGLSYDDFLNIGKDKLPSELYREAMTEIRDMRIETECIVAEIANGFPMLIKTDNAGRTTIREDFAVVGEGGYLAQTVLLYRAHTDINSLAQTIYTVYEAKKYAEGATSVGEFTTLSILHSDGSREQIMKTGRAILQTYYKKFGPQEIDPGILFPPKPSRRRFNPASRRGGTTLVKTRSNMPRKGRAAR